MTRATKPWTRWPRGCEASSPPFRTSNPLAGLAPRLVIIPLAALVFLSAGCADSPERAVAEIVAAVQRGDHEAVAERLTERSRALYLGAVGMAGEGPGFVQPEEQPEVKVLSTRKEGAALVLKVQEGSKRRSLSLLLEGGKWRVDLMRTARLGSPLGFDLPPLPGAP